MSYSYFYYTAAISLLPELPSIWASYMGCPTPSKGPLGVN